MIILKVNMDVCELHLCLAYKPCVIWAIPSQTYGSSEAQKVYSTLFSRRSAHENQPNFLRSQGHRPRPRIILILSIGLETNSFAYCCQDHLKKNWHDPRSGSVTQGHREIWGKSMCTSFGEESICFSYAKSYQLCEIQTNPSDWWQFSRQVHEVPLIKINLNQLKLQLKFDILYLSLHYDATF